MKRTLKLTVLSFKGIVFEQEVESVYLTGTEGEFELLPYHFPLVAALPDGEIKIAGYDPIPIKVGIVLFRENYCKIMVELAEGVTQIQQTWDSVPDSVAGTE